MTRRRELGFSALGLSFGVAIGTGLGVSLGALIGAATGDVATWIAIATGAGSGMGASIGMSVGYAMSKAARDQCPACGYTTRGLPSPICPECGADYEALRREEEERARQLGDAVGDEGTPDPASPSDPDR